MIHDAVTIWHDAPAPTLSPIDIRKGSVVIRKEEQRKEKGLDLDFSTSEKLNPTERHAPILQI